MKAAYLLILILFSSLSMSKGLSWASLSKGKKYKIQTKLVLEDRNTSFTLKKDSKLELVDNTILPMIKIRLLKFKLRDKDCPSNSMETELKLHEVEQKSKKKVDIGYDLAKKCELGIYIDKKDFLSMSIFN